MAVLPYRSRTSRVNRVTTMLSERGLLIFCMYLLLLLAILLIMHSIQEVVFTGAMGAIFGYVFRDHAGPIHKARTRSTDEDSDGR
jgi:hypothetical protein